MIDYFENNAFGQKNDTCKVDSHILYPMPATFIRDADINLVHKAVQDCRLVLKLTVCPQYSIRFRIAEAVLPSQ